jgi:tRNA (mo5U34)-methyltransferase
MSQGPGLTDFFQTGYSQLVTSPNGRRWWHNMPLPDGSRIDGANPDKDHQLKMWQALQIPNEGGLDGKIVLDIGANDGFFTLAALKAGARRAVAINSPDWDAYPHNILFAQDAWGVHSEIVTGDFRTYPFREKFDVIFFFGVLYHLQDVFTPIRQLRDLLADNGVLYIETQMSKIESDLPLFESASDIYPTVVIQYKAGLANEGLSNYLMPNEPAMRNLADAYGFGYESLDGPHNLYTQENPLRRFFKLTKGT